MARHKLVRPKSFDISWSEGAGELPAVLQKRHIVSISISGAIGTGLFLGSGEALKNGGPAGILLGYAIMGTVIYCLNVSLAEMASVMPDCIGPVGLANRFVDPALGFAMGWHGWYSWSIVVPGQISAASGLVGFWDWPSKLGPIWPAVFLFLAVFVNCFGVRALGEIQFCLSTIKMLTIILIVITSIVLDAGAGALGPIGFTNWSTPLSQLDDIQGTLGRLLGFFAVMIQATFAYCGSEVAGAVAGEIVKPSETVPFAIRLSWFKTFIFYICGVFSAGLLVPSSHPLLRKVNADSWERSPFIIAMQDAGSKWVALPHILVVLFITSALSAAATDVYISSRYLYFLSKNGHAPAFMGRVYKWTIVRAATNGNIQTSSLANSEVPVHSHRGSKVIPTGLNPSGGYEPLPQEPGDIPLLEISRGGGGSPSESKSQFTCAESTPLDQVEKPKNSNDDEHVMTVPWVGLLMAAAFSTMSFMCLRGTSDTPRRSEMTFRWLATMTATSSLQYWIGMLFTYIRWHQGISYREKALKDSGPGNDAEKYANETRNLEYLKKNRAWGQPYLAIYAFFMCGLILFFYGWRVLVNGSWKVYQSREEEAQELLENPNSFQDHIISVNTFITSYIPIPIYLLLLFGYKLINQTRMVPVEKMVFWTGDERESEETPDEANQGKGEPPTPVTKAKMSWRKIITLFFA